MQGYLLIEGESHELAIVPGAGGGYRLPDGRSIALLPALGDAPAGVRVGDRRYDAEIAVAADSIWVHLDGTTYEVTQLGSDELQIDMTNSPYPIFAGLVPLCLDGSPAQTQDVCGA